MGFSFWVLVLGFSWCKGKIKSYENIKILRKLYLRFARQDGQKENHAAKVIKIQVNLCEKLSFLNQLTHNMTKDCSFNSPKFRTCCVQKLCFCFDIQNNICTQHVLKLYLSCHSMNNLSSYWGLTNSRIRASDTDLPVLWSSQCHSFKMYLVITVFCIYVSTRTSKYNLRWRHWTDLETFFCVGDSPRRWFLDLLSNRFTLENICNTSEHICMLGVSPSLVSRYCEGYSFWSAWGPKLKLT